MTTKELERGKSKCVKYWPDQGHTKEWGSAKVTCLSESSTNDYTLREFLFSWKNKEERRIYHYHFQVWPDHGVPSDPGCVLNFLHDVNARQEQIMLDGVMPVSGAIICSWKKRVKIDGQFFFCICHLTCRDRFVFIARRVLAEREHLLSSI